MNSIFIFLFLLSTVYLIYCLSSKKRRLGLKKWIAVVLAVISLAGVGTTSTNTEEAADSGQKAEQTTETARKKHKQSPAIEKQTSTQQAAKKTNEAQKKSQLAKRQAEQKEQQQKRTAAKKVTTDLAALEYQGTQTITVNNNVPTFSKTDLELKNGAWERYGDLDSLNRATTAEAMLNQSTMPKKGETRGSISAVTPTGWKNKRISSGYLYNRSHLIGWALSAENDNWRNLITGTRQLNSPEMLRFEMDTKAYLEQSSTNYVRYSVTPVFRGDELLARGVHMMAQSVNDNELSFNVYIFNVQSGVKLDYSDGSSNVTAVVSANNNQQSNSNSVANNAASSSQEQTSTQTRQSDQQNITVYVTPTGSKYHLHPHGRGHFTQTTLRDAKAQGLQPCKVCDPPA